jgi:hypothetical protein
MRAVQSQAPECRGVRAQPVGDHSYRLVGRQTFVTLNNLTAALNNEVVDQKLFLIIGYSDASEYLGFSIELSLLRAGSVLNY